jgi:hypothetical protein
VRRTALVALLAAVPATSEASEFTITSEFEPEARNFQLDLLLSGHVRSRFGFIPGLIFSFPVAPQGFISALNDCFFIEAGVFLGAFFDPSVFFLAPAAGVRWSFYLTREWAVFAVIRLGWALEFFDPIDHFVYIDGDVGAHWHFSDMLALRLETGGTTYGYRFVVGLSWQLPLQF